MTSGCGPARDGGKTVEDGKSLFELSGNPV
jgi:hypothetical protein